MGISCAAFVTCRSASDVPKNKGRKVAVDQTNVSRITNIINLYNTFIYTMYIIYLYIYIHTINIITIYTTLHQKSWEPCFFWQNSEFDGCGSATSAPEVPWKLLLQGRLVCFKGGVCWIVILFFGCFFTNPFENYAQVKLDHFQE